MDFTAIALAELPDGNVELYEQEEYDTFTCFSKLPAELRIKIWKLALPTNRRINVRARIEIFSHADHQLVHFRSRTRPPALFQVSHESRSTVKPLYKVLLKDRHDSGLRTYWNPHMDTVVFKGCGFREIGEIMMEDHGSIMFQTLKDIQYLELNNVKWSEVFNLLMVQPLHIMHSTLYPVDPQKWMLFTHLRDLKKLHMRVAGPKRLRGRLGTRFQQDRCLLAIAEQRQIRKEAYGGYEKAEISINIRDKAALHPCHKEN